MSEVGNDSKGPRPPNRGKLAKHGVKAVELGTRVLGDHAAVVRAAQRLSAAHGQADDHPQNEEFSHRMDEISVDDYSYPDEEPKDDGATRAKSIGDLAEAEGTEDGDELDDQQRQHQSGGGQSQFTRPVNGGHVDDGLNAFV